MQEMTVTNCGKNALSSTGKEFAKRQGQRSTTVNHACVCLLVSFHCLYENVIRSSTSS